MCFRDHGFWLSRSLTFGSSAATYEATTQATETRNQNRNSPVPFSCQTPGGSGWAARGQNEDNVPTFAKTFADKKGYFREREKKLSHGFSSINMKRSFAIKNSLQGPLDRLPYRLWTPWAVFLQGCSKKKLRLTMRPANWTMCKIYHTIAQLK